MDPQQLEAVEIDLEAVQVKWQARIALQKLDVQKPKDHHRHRGLQARAE